MSDSEVLLSEIDPSALPIDDLGVINKELVQDIIGVVRGVTPSVVIPPSPKPPSENDPAMVETDQDITATSSQETKNDSQEKEPMDSDTEDKNNGEPVKPCRELKSILALSKEAKLDTNISHKRKTLEAVKVKEKEAPSPVKGGGSSDNEGGSTTGGGSSSSLKRQNSKITTEHRSIRYPVTAECELESSFVVAQSSDDVTASGKEEKTKTPSKITKRKRDSSNELSPGGATDDFGKRNRKSYSNEIVMFKHNKDMFCWRCHRDDVSIACETCPRSYHQKCLKQTIADPEHWPCPECVAILRAESTQTRSEAMKGMSLEHLCNLLKFAANRMMKCSGSEPFIHAVSEKEFPDYSKYIIQPMDLTLMEKNIKENLYGSTQAFEADAKWILHNSIIFNSYQSKLTTAAKGIVKICKQEMAEIENCHSCYLNANTKRKTWFVEVCPKPHLLVWAKLKGFPYWPAKAMRANSMGMVDVRFFGAHDRAWVPSRECYLFSTKDPNSYKQKRFDIEKCLKELNIYVENLRKIYVEVHLAPFKTFYDPDNEIKQLKMFLPRYNTEAKMKIYQIFYKRDGDDKKDETSNTISELEPEDKKNEYSANEDKARDDLDATMEGYGTDDEGNPEIDSARREMLNSSKMELEETDRENVKIQIDVSTLCKKDKMNRSNVKTNNFSGKLKVSPETAKTISAGVESTHFSTGNLRRNSDQSGKSDSSRLSNFSEKIQHVELEETAEITLGNSVRLGTSEVMSSNTSDSSKDSDAVVDPKQKPVQVEVNLNSELSISPQSKLKITEKLIKRLSDGDGTPLPNDKADNVSKSLSFEEKFVNSGKISKKISETEAKKAVEVSSSKEAPKKDKKIAKVSTEVATVKPKTQVTVKAVEEKSSLQNVEKLKKPKKLEPVLPVEKGSSETVIAAKPLVEKANEATKKSDSGASADKTIEGTIELEEEIKKKSSRVDPMDVIEEFEDSEGTETMDSSQIDETDIRNIIHSSLNDNQEKSLTNIERIQSGASTETTWSPVVNKKRKLSAEKEERCQTKLIKLGNTVKSTDKSKAAAKSSSDGSDSSSLQSNDQLQLKVKVKKITKPQILKEQKLPSNTNDSLQEPVEMEEIKSEPESEEDSDAEYMEAKRKYLSALNISEKQKMSTKGKLNEIRTRSKTEEKKERFKVVDNLTKIIDDVALNYSANNDGRKALAKERRKSVGAPTPILPRDESKDIYIKSFTNMQLPKQRARKSFPTPNYLKTPAITTNGGSTARELPQLKSAAEKPLSNPPRTVITTIASTTNSSTPPIQLPALEPLRTAGSLVFLTQPQNSENVLLLPTNQISYGPSMFTMVPPLISSSISNNAPQTVMQHTLKPNLNHSQNYIPPMERREAAAKAAAQAAAALAESSSNQQLPPTDMEVNENVDETTVITTNSTSVAEESDEFGVLHSLVPENVSKAVNELLCRPPPKLRARPPGPLSKVFDEGVPSAAGTVTSRINSIAHRLGDYFRGMLIETLEDLGKTSNPEATISTLKMEVETLTHKHETEVLEIRKNVCTILKDIQKSIVEERERIVDETRAACEAEAIKRVEEAKSKQWCANCTKEAQFYCCWNTSYCDYPCQQKHWPKHLNKCTQNLNQSTTTATLRPAGQPLVLRPTNPPKQAFSRIIAKPTKVYMNRTNVVAPKNVATFKVQTSTGSQITIMESTPGNFELVGNGPIAVGGKILATNSLINKIKSANVTVTSPSINKQKTTVTQSKSPAPAVSARPAPVTTISDDDSD